MSRAAFAGLGATAALLAGAIAWELQGIEGDPVARGAAAAAVARWRPAPEVPTPAPPDRSGEWAATALARPLFAQDRRPVAEPRLAAAGGPAARDLPRLAGVMITPGGGAAIFAPAGEHAKPQVLRVGDRLGEFEVKAILAGEVMLAGPEGERSLRTSFDPRPAAVGPPRPAVAVAAPATPLAPQAPSNPNAPQAPANPLVPQAPAALAR
ncbi:hypothetical protein [Paracraurococcus lichenis]|uniref:Type II secretion system protein GspC N-terminal domain-containing protein n=1 Tax=Paracraurococcus lichenis TaxID=3064888 RepID=A0ABT9E8A4_9PROT|nr:hypothetical protein [Paracraurococcus sp. LOR1-02]MDO9712295.1 hypothetical protein [Paracraurococcus sp. LOR1-02]